MTQPTLYLVAGPNGAGKSTLTKSGRFGEARIVDPDAIARRIAPDDPQRAAAAAGRTAIRERQAALAAARSLVVETTLAGSTALRWMHAARVAGYRVELHYVSVNSAAVALHRIANRVAQGGHPVPEADVRRRFDRSRTNLPAAIRRADATTLYDNSERAHPHRRVAILEPARCRFAERPPRWATDAARRAGLTIEADRYQGRDR